MLLLQTKIPLLFNANQAKAQSGLEYDPNDPATWPPCPLCDCDFDEYANCCCGGVDICDCITCGEQYDCGEFHICCTETCICGEVYYCYKGHECDEETCPDCECLIDPWGECCCENEEDCQCDYCGEQYVCNNGHTCLCFCNNCQISYVCQEEHVCNCQCCGNNCTTCGKLLPTGLKSASTNTSCEVCDCVPNPIVTLSISELFVELGEQYNISINFVCNIPSVKPYEIKLDVVRGDGYNTYIYVDANDGASQTFSDILGENQNLRVLGTTIYTVTYKYMHNGTGYSKSESNMITHMRASHSKIEQQFYYQMYALWMSSLNYCQNNTGYQIEYSLAINQNKANGELTGDENAGVTTPCGPGSVTVPISVTNDMNEITVGTFHTHPPMTFCGCNVSRTETAGPSTPDRNNFSFLASFVWDYNVPISQIICEHNLMMSNGLYEYGQCRTTP